ncbi:membrane assembly protein AsmA, partial [Aeromonas salmonicida]
AGSTPTDYFTGSLGDLGRGLFPLEALKRRVSFSPQQINAEVQGKAYEGEFNLSLALDTQQQKLTLKDITLSGMDIS